MAKAAEVAVSVEEVAAYFSGFFRDLRG